jgi:hypothetical protein
MHVSLETPLMLLPPVPAELQAAIHPSCAVPVPSLQTMRVHCYDPQVLGEPTAYAGPLAADPLCTMMTVPSEL